MIQPDFKTFCKLARQGNLVPVYDTFTPVSAYQRLAHDARYACLLESVEGGEKIARYTFVGANPVEVFRYVNGACVLESESRVSWVQSNPLDYLRNRVERYRPVRLPGLPPLVAGAIGYFAYDMVRLVERIPDTARDDVGMDDAVMMFYLGLVVFDHVRHRLWIVRNVFTDGEGSLRAKYDAAVREIRATRKRLDEPVAAEHPKRRRRRPFKVTSNFSRPRFLDAVRKSKEYIRAGDIFQVAISQRFAAKTDADPFEIYRALRVVNPSPYMYFLKLNDLAVVGSSPEMLLKVQGREAFYRPIAGTRPRGADEKEDLAMETELAADPKERAEHIMLVDLGRNDLGRVSEYGSVCVEKLMFVERYSHVMHLVSSLRGRLREEVDCFDALAACFPGGRRCGRWKSLMSSNPRGEASTAVRSSISILRGIWTLALRFGPWSSRRESRMCRPGRAWWRIPFRRASTMRPSARRAPYSKPSKSFTRESIFQFGQK